MHPYHPLTTLRPYSTDGARKLNINLLVNVIPIAINTSVILCLYKDKAMTSERTLKIKWVITVIIILVLALPYFIPDTINPVLVNFLTGG